MGACRMALRRLAEAGLVGVSAALFRLAVRFCLTDSLLREDKFTGHRRIYRVFYGFARMRIKTVETFCFRLSRRF